MKQVEVKACEHVCIFKIIYMDEIKCGIVSKISNIGHILRYCISIVSYLNFQYRPSPLIACSIYASDKPLRRRGSGHARLITA